MGLVSSAIFTVLAICLRVPSTVRALGINSPEEDALPQGAESGATQAANAAFRDGLYQGKLAVEQGNQFFTGGKKLK
jgi:hypothetical protein